MTNPPPADRTSNLDDASGIFKKYIGNLMTKFQCSSTKIQTNNKFKIPMTETGESVYSDSRLCFVHRRRIGHWLLFVIWDLGFVFLGLTG